MSARLKRLLAYLACLAIFLLFLIIGHSGIFDSGGGINSVIPNVKNEASPVLPEDMTFAELRSVLEELGITGISDEMLLEMEESVQNITATLPQGFELGWSSSDYLRDLLALVGMGSYDPDTWEWTPSSTQVYWFDMEAFIVPSMYTDFLSGITHISEGKLVAENIVEDQSGVDYYGEGVIRLSFDLNGEPCTLKLKSSHDWYDLTILDKVNRLLKQHGIQERLHFTYDSGQGVIVFFCSSDWAELFTQKTGVALYTSSRNLNFY